MTFLSFFQRGTKESSSRLIGLIIILNALLLLNFVIIFKILKAPEADITALLLSAGGLFIQVAGPAMYFLFKQKQTEVSQPNTITP